MILTTLNIARWPIRKIKIFVIIFLHAEMEFVLLPCVRGYQVHEKEWVAILGEQLREIGNVINCYAVAVKRPQVK